MPGSIFSVMVSLLPIGGHRIAFLEIVSAGEGFFSGGSVRIRRGGRIRFGIGRGKHRLFFVCGFFETPGEKELSGKTAFVRGSQLDQFLVFLGDLRRLPLRTLNG